ncbi:MAG: CPBP family intramembrane metalloprotease [Chitinophagaceae bacterium]|nr:CPBP family intramembrane metalloprotease [Chitinophagaceae bacterium]
MLGILFLILISAILLWLTERKPLTVLGITPSIKRCMQLCTGLLITGLLCTGYHLLLASLVKAHWVIVPFPGIGKLVSGMGWVLRSVLFEELIFRGAVLYLLIQKLGPRKAVWMAAIGFGIYHWFSYQLWSQPVAMLYVLLITGAAGWGFAYAFQQTRALYLPIGLHLGWNLVHIIVFAQGSIGAFFWKINDPTLHKTNEWLPTLVLFLYQLSVIPVAVWLYCSRLRKKNKPA